MKTDLFPESVSARLRVLRDLYVPQRVGAEARAVERDLSPEAVAGRLAELRALLDLARYLHSGARAGS